MISQHYKQHCNELQANQTHEDDLGVTFGLATEGWRHSKDNQEAQAIRNHVDHADWCRFAQTIVTYLLNCQLVRYVQDRYTDESDNKAVDQATYWRVDKCPERKHS